MGLEWMIAPVAACLVMAAILGWFGLHVLEREVIFVDLALAQIAALGTTYAVYLGHEPEEPLAYALGLAFTVLGAFLFAWVRAFEDRVPPEALIGVTYVVSAATAAVLLDFAADPHGAEKLRHLLVGNVVWVRWSEVATMAAVAAAVGVAHWFGRRGLIEVTFHPERATGRWIAAWDLAFYLSFGLVISAMVHVAGVLLIFTYLIIPAVVARLFVNGIGARLAVAWSLAAAASLVGVGVSYEHAAGPIIVVLLGGALLLALIAVAMRRSPGRVAGVVVAVSIATFATHRALSGGEEHAHDAQVAHPHADEVPVHDDLPHDADPLAREAWYRGHLDRPDLLRAALNGEEDPSLRLLLGAALVRTGDAEGLRVLASLTRSDVPFLRMEAHDRLRLVAGPTAPDYEPLAAPDDGAWQAWARTPPEGWTDRAGEVALP